MPIPASFGPTWSPESCEHLGGPRLLETVIARFADAYRRPERARLTPIRITVWLTANGDFSEKVDEYRLSYYR